MARSATALWTLQFRRVATRYDKLAANFLSMIQLASARLWLRAYLVCQSRAQENESKRQAPSASFLPDSLAQ